MSEVKLSATPRNDFGKGAARRLRRDHQVPAVLYGHGTDPVHVALPGHATMLALKGNANALLTIEIEGKSQLALPKDVQRHPLKGTIEHVDLLIVRRGEKVTVEVPVHFTGDPAPGGLAQIETNSLSLEVEATAIPDGVEHSIEGLAPGTQVLAGQITLPSGASLAGDAEAIVLVVSDASRSSEDAPAEGDAEAPAEA
ncbi:50S ribosomal protein L25/general stress protein Ctc [Kineosporia sp. J2-2]|uniref:Large ribosomal subunit protein bL25 n=1 Tax=Kineosporia corallincola TaxID=2835133 RepID=A0ABS5THI4_9ACTN|nr:50S ribosomal protein L25/general stress protein Ctc [Kineosporia corallincola]MBT0770556.1 50S ribosomal protein L25/general stress protein Ctc [Kineosporia corallincola]